MNWSTVSFIRIPKERALSVCESSIQVLDVSYEFQYNSGREVITFRCRARDPINTFRDRETERDILVQEMAGYLERSIESEKPIYEQPDFLKIMEDARRDSISLFLGRHTEVIEIHSFNEEFRCEGGEGFAFGEKQNELLLEYKSLSYKLVEREYSMSNEPLWLIRGVLEGCSVHRDVSIFPKRELRINYVSYSERKSVNFQEAEVVNVSSDQDNTYRVEFKAEVLPLVGEITSRDLRNIQMTKLKNQAGANDTTTGQRILAIHVNEEISEMVKSDSRSEKSPKANNDGVKRRFLNMFNS